VAPGPRQVAVPGKSGGVQQHCPPVPIGQLTPRQPTVAGTQAELAHSNPPAQPVVLRLVHEVPQALELAQAKLPGHGLGLATTHVPAPLQVSAGLKVEPLQVAAPHEAPWTRNRQIPPPQVPSWPQRLTESSEHSLSGSVPDVIALHRPLATPVSWILHARQRPIQELSQQTLSTHAFDSHSSFDVHGFPSGCGPFTMLGAPSSPGRSAT
jgi:hypothetical protein